jgi:hypothetical protein
MDEAEGRIEHMFDTRLRRGSTSRDRVDSLTVDSTAESPGVASRRMTEFLFDTRAGLILIGAVGLVLLVLIAGVISRPFDRWWLTRRRGRGNVEEEVPIPAHHEPKRDTFLELNFTSVATIRDADGSIHTFLLHDDGSVAEIATYQKRRSAPITILELTSVLAGGRGLLTTSSSGLGLNLWAGELRQVFPGADELDLVRKHREALGWLLDRGIQADRQMPEEILELRSGFLSRINEAAAKSSTGLVRSESWRIAHGAHANVGRLWEQDDIEGRLNRFRELIREQVPDRPDRNEVLGRQ